MIRRWRGLLLALVAGCSGGAREAEPSQSAARSTPEAPLWERPGLYGAARPEMGRPQPGDIAPAIDLPFDGGGTFRGSSLRGAWVVLHFTASWCPYCDAEVEHLGTLASEYGPRGVKVVLIDIEEDVERWTSYAKAHVPPSVIALRDATGDVAKRFAPPRAQPSFADRAQVMLDATLVLDPGGKIRLFLFPDSKHFDPTFAAVRRELGRLLEQSVLPPEQVVAIEARTGAMTGGRGELVVLLRIAPGYHVMSERPSAPEYIATRIALDGATDVKWGAPRYPPPASFQLADKSIDTFQGDAEVRIPFEVATTSATARRSVSATLRYQACTATSCLFPVTRTFDVRVP